VINHPGRGKGEAQPMRRVFRLVLGRLTFGTRRVLAVTA
jgi:hypothetical protein